MSKEYDRRRRAKFVRPLAEMPTWQAVGCCENMDRRELLATRRAMESCTTNNCWYGEWDTARALLPIVRQFLKQKT